MSDKKWKSPKKQIGNTVVELPERGRKVVAISPGGDEMIMVFDDIWFHENGEVHVRWTPILWSDSGRQIGDCKHGNTRETCRECEWDRLERMQAEHVLSGKGPLYRIKRLTFTYAGGRVWCDTPVGRFYVEDRYVLARHSSRLCTDLDDGKRVAQAWFEELMREGLEEVK